MSAYPGVYIFEKSGLSLGAAGMSGLVPLLVGRFFRKDDGSEVTLANGLTQIVNWSEFAETFLSTPLKVGLTEEWVEEPVVSTGKKGRKKKANAGAVSEEQEALLGPEGPLTLTEEHLNTGALALLNYFNNGGGPCYLLSVGEEDKPDDIASQIEEYSELSLLAVIDASVEKLYDMNKSLDTFITENKQSFLLASMSEKSEENSYTNKTHVALYTPDLRLTSSPILYEDGIFISYGSDPTPISMTMLKVGTPAEQVVYNTVKTALREHGVDYTAVQNPVISPVAAAAGAYCMTERSRGIWKAPANVKLAGATPVRAIGKTEHGDMNAQGVNAILWQPSTNSTAIMGARTREEASKTAWRYVSVRLLFNTVERDVRNMLSPVVFEPNSASTWQSVTAAIKNYLFVLWKKGGLYGTTPESAFRVELALEGDDIANGILRVRVGLSALRPVEFIYLEFTQDMPAVA
ncbi:phage tail sheath C-terminal domain-containing protein [Serratia marcescens]|uniref:phage tail sheath C-terminal domain-containing protein n=1 Tax=Serratia marcescens TaxID=615 RepID=UPI003204839B